MESFAGELSSHPHELEELYRISALVRAPSAVKPLSKMTADEAAGPGYKDRPSVLNPGPVSQLPFRKIG